MGEMSTMKKLAIAALAALTLVGIAGCTPTVHTEYEVYRSADALAEAATDVVQVTIVSAREDTLESKPFEGTDPETNPYYGSDTEQPPPVSIDVMIYEATIEQSFKGAKLRGGTIEISQLRGEAEGVPLEEGATYVLYLQNVDPEYPAGIVGGSQGQYLYEDGRLTPADPETGFDISVEQLSSLN